MKKLFLFAILLTSFASAYGQSSVTTIVQGIVPQILKVSSEIIPVTNVDILNSNQATLGYINVFSNSTGNWKITISSTNAGQMRGITSGNADVYPYTLKFGTTSNINLSTPYTLEMSGSTTTNGAAYSLGVEYQNFWNLSAPVSPDTYRDTITITIGAA